MRLVMLSMWCKLLALLVLTGGQPDENFWKPMVDVVVVAATTQDEVESTTLSIDNDITYDELEYYDTEFGFGLELWLIVWERLKFRLRIVIPQGVAANSASALPMLVSQGEANFSIVATVFGPEETKGLAMTQPTHNTRFKLFVQSPTSVSTSLSLGKVFTPVLWITLVVSMLMMGVILIFIEFVGQKAKIRSYLATPADIGQLVIIVIGCFCYQGAIQIASGCSGRILVWTSLICGYLIYVTFNTEVISQLTTVSFKPPFDSLEDMAAKGTHKLIVRNETSLLDNIKVTRIRNGKRGIMADVWDKLLPMKPKPENMYNDKKEVPRLCKENVAFLDSELAIPPKIQQASKCNVMTLKDSYFPSNLGFVLKRNNTSAFNRQIKKMFNRMRETGIINRVRRNIDQPDVGPLKPLPDLNPIDIQTIIPMLVVLYLGMFASIITLALEIAFNRVGEELIRKLEGRGYHSWKDVVCFWRVKKKNLEDESSSEDEEPISAPTIKFTNTPQSPVKVKSVVENVNERKTKKSDFLAPPAKLKSFQELHNYVNQQMSQRADDTRPPLPLRRQNRVADLNTNLPEPIKASFTPQYLDKNVVRDIDSSQESNQFESPRPDEFKIPSPHVKPRPIRPARRRRVVSPPKKMEEPVPENRFPVAAAPQYYPQELLNEMLRIALFFALCVASALATDFRTCSNARPVPDSVVVSGCESLPCDFVHGTDLVNEITFTSGIDADNLKPKVMVTTLGLVIDYPLPNQDVCADLIFGGCPLVAGDVATYKLTMPILNDYPLVSMTIEFSILDGITSETLTCFEVDGQVVNA
ncbi:Hypothetical predicted protein [Cloeon dipterum]|uniref:MD-2-related lipid-recognition domain-containing protein n=1 Tax=Cloeon dipterum TaxID=197152 RepID=A0A8S1C2C0_9INSE|nr:Hypothetical predicted protein [Cloeon dipterum]